MGFVGHKCPTYKLMVGNRSKGSLKTEKTVFRLPLLWVSDQWSAAEKALQGIGCGWGGRDGVGVEHGVGTQAAQPGELAFGELAGGGGAFFRQFVPRRAVK